MTRTASRIFALTAAAALALQGCRDGRTLTGLAGGAALFSSKAAPELSDRYVVLFAAERVPADFAERVSRLGGWVEAMLDSIGVAAISGLTEAAAAELAASNDIGAVERDAVVTIPSGDMDDADESTDGSTGEFLAPADATASPMGAQFYARQWHMRAVFAHKAWEAGHLGSRDVTVAILDSGIDYLHPDLAGLVDLSRSVSFVPEDDKEVAARFPGRHPITDLNWHGTAAASIVGSNAVLMAGVNKHVTLIGVKVFGSFAASTVSRVLRGLLHAADHDADVITLSLGVLFDKRSNPGLIASYNRATTYAFRKGAVVVAIAQNLATDLDHNGDQVLLPCESAQVICASATGPTAASSVEGPWVNVDAPAPYSGFGRSAVHVAAPGGIAARFRTIWLPCTKTPVASPRPGCQAGQPIDQGVGTSWAAPHVAGLAALLVAQLGKGNPGLIRARILESADDLGESGTDPYYGKGRINIARTLGVMR